MKKILSILLLFPVLFSLFSCPAGLCSIPLDVFLYIKKPDGSSFSKDELNSLKVSAVGGSVRGNFYKNCKEQTYHDKDGHVHLWIQYRLGSTHFKWKIKKILKSYKRKMKNFSFKIEDPSGTYKTYIMKPLDDSYKLVQDTNYDIMIVLYTVTLENV